MTPPGSAWQCQVAGRTELPGDVALPWLSQNDLFRNEREPHLVGRSTSCVAAATQFAVTANVP